MPIRRTGISILAIKLSIGARRQVCLNHVNYETVKALSWILGSTGTRLSFIPGSNQIKFEGTSSSRIYWEWDWDIVPNDKAE